VQSLPLVSLVIPAFNPRFFEKSLRSAVGQGYGNLEIIVCDDSRGTEIGGIVGTVVEQTGVAVRYVRNPHTLGLVGNLKACLAQAQGELIKFLCDDDLLYSACIEQQVHEMLRDEVSLVLAQRLLWDADDIILPMRLENTSLSPTSGLFKGDDLLGIFEKFPVNVLGGFSNALFRRADVMELLPALTQAGHCFVATLDFALFICLMRRGNVAVSNNVLSAERLYPERLSAQQPMKDAAEIEREWISQMLKVRSGESAPASGWVRYMPLTKADESPRVWEELPLSRTLGTKQSRQELGVGVDSLSFRQNSMRTGCSSGADRGAAPMAAGNPRQAGRISLESYRSLLMIKAAAMALSARWKRSPFKTIPGADSCTVCFLRRGRTGRTSISYAVAG
jgi:hypothetical protein